MKPAALERNMFVCSYQEQHVVKRINSKLWSTLPRRGVEHIVLLDHSKVGSIGALPVADQLHLASLHGQQAACDGGDLVLAAEGAHELEPAAPGQLHSQLIRAT